MPVVGYLSARSAESGVPMLTAFHEALSTCRPQAFGGSFLRGLDNAVGNGARARQTLAPKIKLDSLTP